MPGMSLLSSYEGLRQEIQRLAQENEELRRLVQLIQENQELKLVLRNRGSSLGFCSSGILAEVAASPRPSRRRTIKFKDAERGEKRQGPWSFTPSTCAKSLESGGKPCFQGQQPVGSGRCWGTNMKEVQPRESGVGAGLDPSEGATRLGLS